ncbi:MAG: nucleoside phosphorylase [Cyclobacteriaceae bacterium]
MPRIPESELIINPDGSVYHLNLKPEHVTDTVIVVGDPGRVHRVSQFFDDVEFEMNKREFITHVGKYKGKKLMVLSTGMGTDNVEIVMTELDALANIDFKKRELKKEHRQLKIIRVGSSASLQEDIRVGSHLISEYAIGLDTLMFFYNLPQSSLERSICKEIQKTIGLDFIPYCVKGSSELMVQFGDGLVKGNTVTSPGFYAPQGRELRLPIKFKKLLPALNRFHFNDFWLTNFEMETAGYYALGHLLGHQMVSVNAILANRTRNTFSKNPNKVVDSLIKKVLERI